MRLATRLAIFVLAATAAWAQNPTAALVGSPSDPSGAVVPGGAISARHVATNAVRAAAKHSHLRGVWFLFTPGAPGVGPDPSRAGRARQPGLPVLRSPR
jgi:hypothetical protein